jgi:glutathione S-transferase
MPAFTLYGGRGSSNTDRVRLVLAEGGFTDFDYQLIDLRKGDQKVSIRPSCQVSKPIFTY